MRQFQAQTPFVFPARAFCLLSSLRVKLKETVRKLMDSHSVEGDTKIWKCLAKVMSMASGS